MRTVSTRLRIQQLFEIGPLPPAMDPPDEAVKVSIDKVSIELAQVVVGTKESIREWSWSRELWPSGRIR